VRSEWAPCYCVASLNGRSNALEVNTKQLVMVDLSDDAQKVSCKHKTCSYSSKQFATYKRANFSYAHARLWPIGQCAIELHNKELLLVCQQRVSSSVTSTAVNIYRPCSHSEQQLMIRCSCVHKCYCVLYSILKYVGTDCCIDVYSVRASLSI
jgi:hypothetical protein